MIDAHGGSGLTVPADVAASTAQTVLAAGRSGDSADLGPLLGLADLVGIETLASLWRSAEPSSLAGSLWALYLLRQWCQSAPRDVSELWTSGAAVLAADTVVAGVGMHGDEQAVQAFADATLTGAFRGDFGVALERAAAFFRVVGAGRQRSVREDGAAPEETERALRNDQAARSLAIAAARWRAGTLV